MSPEDSRIRVFLVHDQALVRTALRLLFESWPGISVVKEAATLAEAIEGARTEKPDIVVLDVDLRREPNGLHDLPDVRKAAPETRIIVLSDDSDSESRLQAVRSGAMGVVMKQHGADELRMAIQKVHNGEAWLDRVLTASVINEIWRRREPPKVDPEVQRIATLTERERQVASLVCRGMANGLIAGQLSICETTVRHHLTSIFSKLEVANRFELVIFLYKHKFGTSPQT